MAQSQRNLRWPCEEEWEMWLRKDAQSMSDRDSFNRDGVWGSGLPLFPTMTGKLRAPFVVDYWMGFCVMSTVGFAICVFLAALWGTFGRTKRNCADE